jgi:hypothetical protein
MLGAEDPRIVLQRRLMMEIEHLSDLSRTSSHTLPDRQPGKPMRGFG